MPAGAFEAADGAFRAVPLLRFDFFLAGLNSGPPPRV